ncbi:organic cation transporter protein-like, partial [Amyelois transitella]|uniref:organic cation transporter protein-like n=1 Tax=Amyelois transitella TaxID=680683 RepID=UPI00298FD3F7
MAIIFLAPSTPYQCLNTKMKNTCPCLNPVYDSSIFELTIISEWNLICNRRWMASFTQTFFQLGTLLGSILFGMASDRFGRKGPLIVAIIIQTTTGILAAYISDIWTFVFTRFVLGSSIGGTMVIGFVICMEFVGTEYRDVMSALYQIPFNMGHLLLPVFSYYFRNFRDFQLAISLPTVILLSYFFLVPETPRWLIATGKTEESVVILERIAKINGLPTENIRSDMNAIAWADKPETGKGNLLDLFRTPNIRKNNLVMAFNWLTCSYCFYGVSQYVSQLSGNIFLNVAVSALMALLGSLVSIPLMRIFGRKPIVVVSHFMCAVCLIMLAFMPEGGCSLFFASTGVVTSFIVLLVVYLYCTELFPTVVRSAALGFSSMTARVGSMVAPFVIDMGQTAVWLPPILFAILPLICGFVTFLLPETKGRELMTTLEEGEKFGKQVKSSSN